MLVLSLFPGIGLLDRGFEDEGFCVVRGPDLLWGGDVHRFHPPAGVFAGVVGGPPCQAHSRLRFLVEHNGYEVAPDLIPEFERVVAEAEPQWFLMENVPRAPLPSVSGYAVQALLLNNRWFGGEQNRERRFSFGSLAGWRIAPQPEPLMPVDWEPAVCASGGACPVPVAVGGTGKVKRSVTERHRATRKGASAMGFKTRGYLAEAIRLQGLSEGFDLPGFTIAGKIKAIGNGVPYPLARAVAKAIKAAV